MNNRRDEIERFVEANESRVSQIRDVLICTNDPEYDGDEYLSHPPIAAPILERETGEAPAVDLGRGLRIDRLPHRDADLVMDSCTPRGHNFNPVRQFGQCYTLIREVNLSEHADHPYRWDPDGVVWQAVVLSRLIRDNGHSTQYAARITDFDSGHREVLYTFDSESKQVYRLRRDREWLDASEGEQLRDLLARYWSVESALPARVTRAMWRAEYASWLRWGDLVISTLVGGLESLLKTERHEATRQFVRRVPALASDLGFADVDPGLCERIYDARSDWVHGAHVKLFATGQEADERKKAGTAEGPQTESQWAIFQEITLIQDVLRAALRRCLVDDEFRAIFEDDVLIRSKWPVAVRE